MKKNPFKIRSVFQEIIASEKKKRFSVKKIILGIFGVIFLSIFGVFIYAIATAPHLDEVKSFTFEESTVIYDSTGEHKLFTVHGDENRKIVPLSDVSQNFINALLATEDDQFFSHGGLDFGGIFKAICHEGSSKVGLGNLGGLCPPRGGSTLTNQLVDNVLPNSGKTYVEKLQEWYLSWKIEHEMSKEEILELYVNKISFGPVLGVETASQAFFGKPAKNLTIAESAVLVAVVKMPTYYSPWGNHPYTTTTLSEEEIQQKGYTTYNEILNLPGTTISFGLRGKETTLANGAVDYFPGRADVVLDRMKAVGYINQEEYDNARKELAVIEFKPFRENIDAPHFVFYIQELLEQQFGDELTKKGGLQVITTLDYDLQMKAEEIVATRADSNASNYNAKNAALLSIETDTGRIVAMVGSKDYWDEDIDGQVNVLLQKRLPGSSFKPIAYAAAFLQGKLMPASVLFDVQTNFGAGWIPQNFDGTFSGPVSVRYALGHSLNIPAIKATIIAGADKVVELSNKMGVTLYNDADFYGNAIALGAGEVRPMDMAQGFSVFANNGKKVPLQAILMVKDRDGNILLDNREPPTEYEEVLDPQVAYLITDVLSDADARGSGWNQYLQLSGRKNAVKTGTSNKKIENTIRPLDLWTIGYTPDYTTVVWAGNNDSSAMNANASGYAAAAPIWQEFMEAAHEDKEARNFTIPEGIKIIPVSRFSGKLPLENTDEKLIVKDKFASFAVPKEVDTSLRLIDVDRISGKLPNEFTPPEAIEKRAILNFHSYFPDKPNWEAPVQAWVSEKGKDFVAAFGVENFIATAPTETTDLYSENTAENKPMITITSPANYGIITPPYVDIRTSANAENGIKKVEFYWDDELKGEINSYPYNETIKIEGDISQGSNHKIKTVVYDKYYYTSSAEIEVKIGSDDSAPNLTIAYPVSNESLPANTTVNFLVEAYDSRSAVDRVDFFIDDQKIGSAKDSPYSVSYKTPASGSYTLKAIAYDTAGNSATQETGFNISDSDISSSSFSIISPNNGSSASAGEAVKVLIGINEDMSNEFEGLTVYTQEEGGVRKSIAEFSKDDLNSQRIFQAVYTQPNKQTEISAAVKFAGKNYYSERITVYTEN